MQYAVNCTARPRHRAGDPAHDIECVDPDQLDLLADPDPEPDPDGELTTTERFERFDRANPHVHALFLHELERWVGEGRGRIGMSLLFGRARWVLTKLSTVGEEFKLNDHHLPYYSRKILAENPEYRALIAIRRSPQADAWLRANYPPAVADAVLRVDLENGRAA